MADNIAKVVMIDRSVYDNLNPPENNTIYFVREGSPYTSKALSLYVGEAKQCDLLDITGETTFDPQTNEYSIPQAYRIDGKLLFSQQTIVTEKLNPEDQKTDDNSYSFFRISMWDSTSGKFKDCTGFPNNVIIVKDGQLPRISSQGVPGDAIKDFTYIDVQNQAIYVFDGNSYIPIISQTSSGVNVDNITILKDNIGGVDDVLHGAGADVSGKQFIINGTTVTAADGAHVFNKYTDWDANIATKPFSSVFGKQNKEARPASFGDIEYTYGCNIVGGYSNIVAGVDRSFVFGDSNQITYTRPSNSQMLEVSVIGNSNALTGSGTYSSNIPVINIFGSSNDITSSVPSDNVNASFVCGRENQVTIDGYKPTTVIGYQNTVSTPTMSSSTYATCVIGDENHISDGNGYTVIGYYNSVSSNSVNHASRGSTLIGAQNYVTCICEEQVNLIGMSNLINGNSNTFARSSHICMVGNTNIINHASSGSSEVKDSYMFGKNNTITRTSQDISSCVLVGNSLTASWGNCVVIGKGNTPTLPTLPYGSNPTLIIGNGLYTSEDPYRNAAILTNANDFIFYSTVKDAATDMSLVSEFNYTDVTPSSGNVTLSTLPQNGDETVLRTSSSVETINASSLTISSTSVPVNGTNVAVNTIKDYCATIAFKPLSPIQSVSALLTNFNPSGQEPKIYLMNPDINISTYTVIHLLLFYDGFNVCCTVAGYEEVSSL